MLTRDQLVSIVDKEPLFQPDFVRSPEQTSENPTPITSVATRPSFTRTPVAGWIYVAGYDEPEFPIRIAVAERSATSDSLSGNANNIDDLSRNLGLGAREILRYVAFSNDAYATLAKTRKSLEAFETQNRRYFCHSALAATAIENSRQSIVFRRTNFEPASNLPDDLPDTLNLSSDQVLPPLLINDETRVARNRAIFELLEETEESLEHASLLLNDNSVLASSSKNPIDLPGIVRRRSLFSLKRRSRNNPAPAKPVASTAPPVREVNGVRISRPVVDRMQQAILRREAVQFLRKSRADMWRKVLVTLILAAAIAFCGTYIANQDLALGTIVLIALAAATTAGLAQFLVLRARYARPAAIWKQMLGDAEANAGFSPQP